MYLTDYSNIDRMIEHILYSFWLMPANVRQLDFQIFTYRFIRDARLQLFTLLRIWLNKPKRI